MRLRMQMDMVIDQLSQCLDAGRVFKEKEDEVRFLDTAQKTFARLCSLCETDAHFAEVAVLYGVAYITETMCSWSKDNPGGEAMTQEAQHLVKILHPHLEKLFKSTVVQDWNAVSLSELLGD